ncbi:MAG TPA: alcohol dehydrogenase catalytic domain-containing protein [Verrucomicrobiae bacterium]
MRAVVYRGANDLRVETVPVPGIGANELLVKVAVCGVCPTDIKKIHYGTVAPPRIFGHETAGTIVKIGAGAKIRATGLKVGDRVALHHHVPCLKCHYCRHRAFAQCETYKRTGITAGFEPAGGGFAEYVRVMDFVLPGVVKIPAKNSFEEGAMLEPVNTVLKAVKRLNLLRGDNVLVAGQGPIGLMFTKILQLRGINVLATDLLESRLKLAKKFGAKKTLLASQLSTINLQLDSAIIAVPFDDAVSQALQLVRGAGQVLLFAHTKRKSSAPAVPSPAQISLAHPLSPSLSPQPGEGPGVRGETGHLPSDSQALPGIQTAGPGLELDYASICLDEKDLIGSYSSDFTIQDEVARLVFSRRLDIRPLITHHYPLEQTTGAIALAAKPTEKSLKIIIQQM